MQAAVISGSEYCDTLPVTWKMINAYALANAGAGLQP